jgi:hypothetical protein
MLDMIDRWMLGEHRTVHAHTGVTGIGHIPPIGWHPLTGPNVSIDALWTSSRRAVQMNAVHPGTEETFAL